MLQCYNVSQNASNYRYLNEHFLCILFHLSLGIKEEIQPQENPVHLGHRK